MKSKNQESRDPAFIAYIKMMKEELSKVPKKPASTIQCASTKALLEMTSEQLAKHRDRPLPTNWLAVPDAKNMDEAVPTRPVTIQEILLQEDIRHKSKNTFGQSEKNGVSDERKRVAVEAFTYSRPTELTPVEQEKLISMNKIKEFKDLPPLPEKSNLFKKLKDLFKAQNDTDKEDYDKETTKQFVKALGFNIKEKK